jgi:hypothetical protein
LHGFSAYWTLFQTFSIAREKFLPFAVSAQSALYTPGAPSRIFTEKPLSSDKAGLFEFFAAKCAFIRALPA